ncbi:MAG: hypothetical protein DBX55_05385 [Verrucomicrobia bacterium]|nr:MAG: hypothetical protein DBX55_05385 [Verrucomicrobiota bacterium]
MRAAAVRQTPKQPRAPLQNPAILQNLPPPSCRRRLYAPSLAAFRKRRAHNRPKPAIPLADRINSEIFAVILHLPAPAGNGCGGAVVATSAPSAKKPAPARGI